MNLDCNKVHIKKENNSFNMEIDDVPIKNAKYIEFRAGVGETSTVSVEFYTEKVEVEVNK